MTAAPRETIDWHCEQMAGAGAIHARPMFGEWGLYCHGRFFGMVCDGALLMKPSPAVAALTGGAEGAPYPGAKPHLWVPQEDWEDAARMAQLVRLTVEALPPSKTPRPRRSARDGSPRRQVKPCRAASRNCHETAA